MAQWVKVFVRRLTTWVEFPPETPRVEREKERTTLTGCPLTSTYVL